MTDPLISVIIPTYNGANKGYLKNAIESVLTQTYKNYEVLIIDDGSTDNTKEFCKKYLINKKVKYFNQKNQGRSSSRNLGIKKSKGNYICFLDDDDVWLKDKLKKQLDFFNNCKDNKIGLLTTWMELINKKGKTIGYKRKEDEGNVYWKIFYDNMVNCSTVMIKKRVFKKVGVFDLKLPVRQDWDLWIRIAKYFSIYQLKKYLVKYRIHDENASKNIHQTIEYGEKLLLKNLKNCPKYFDKNDIMGNFYFEQCENFYAFLDFKNFRKYFLKGIFHSLKRFKFIYFKKIILSFLPKQLFSFFHKINKKVTENV